ncbi:ATP-binding protein [Brevundimonas sp. SORGH_AS_0993]|uniref:GAF domain-containing hybrid sensor histidine kinase/response regulator n=1 Tax=Brevundimonas sp. SORGH_AS_0993 TaxID=3041794 RepID=UPI0027D84E25|nr:ATP-binding protein [Brevundimonas sp. SORGH_AS_0993]
MGDDTETGALIRAADWAGTPLGHPKGWPLSLKAAVGMMLATRQPACLAWGPELTFIYNDAYRPILAGRHPAALGARLPEVWPDVWPDIEPLVETALSGGSTWSEDMHMVMTRKGYPEDTWWSFSYSPLRDDAGQVVGFLDLCLDTTAKVMGERQAKALGDLADLTGATRDPAEVQRLAAALLGRVLGVSRVSYGEADAKAERVIMTRDWTLTGDSLAGEVATLADFGPQIAATLARGETLRIDDIETDPRAAGRLQPYRDRGVRAGLAIPLIRNGRLTAALVLLGTAPRRWSDYDVALAEAFAARTWDAVERARAEEALQALNETLESRVAARTAELQEAQEALRQAQKLEAMGQLTGGVAHDFNNLLTPIFGSLDLLQRRKIGGEREQKLIEGALQSAERARVLVQRLLAFARRQPLQTTAVDVSALVVDMGDLLDSITGPQIRVAIEAHEGLPAARADRNQLEMAILNLGVNARDAMPDGGVLRLSVTAVGPRGKRPSDLAEGSYIRLSVADTGVGMDEATRTRAIEPFFSTKGVGKGTGLGLSMAHGLAAQLGGALTIASAPGLGANIELWLPATEEAADMGPAETRCATAESGLALVVDDEPLVRAATVASLSELGFGVIEADSGEAALALMESGVRPKVLVTDHLMPGLTGVELARQVQNRSPDCAVLIVSGYAEVEDLAPDLPRLVKPFRHADLAAALASTRG